MSAFKWSVFKAALADVIRTAAPGAGAGLELQLIKAHASDGRSVGEVAKTINRYPAVLVMHLSTEREYEDDVASCGHAKAAAALVYISKFYSRDGQEAAPDSGDVMDALLDIVAGQQLAGASSPIVPAGWTLLDERGGISIHLARLAFTYQL